MGLHTQKKQSPEPVSVKNNEQSRGILIIRLVVASVIFAVTAVLKIPAAVKTILLLLSAAAAGYDLVIEAVNCVEKRKFFDISLIVLFVSFIAFVISFFDRGADGERTAVLAIESAAMVILFRIGQILSDYVRERTLMSAEDLLRYRDEEEIERSYEVTQKPGAGDTQAEASIGSAAGFVLLILMGFAVLFAILAPIFTNLTFRDSIHRALCMILIATPGSVVLSIPLAGLVGVYSASRFGTLFNKASSIEKLPEVKTVIIDKAGVLAEEYPKVLSVQPMANMVDAGTFMTFAAHAVYYSEQPIAKALSNATDGEYKLEVISNFSDIPGFGVELDIGGAHVVLATKELYISRGETVPYEFDSPDRQSYYMTISGRYVGKIIISRTTIASTENIVRDLKANGAEKCILVSEEGNEDVAAFASRLGFDDAFGELDVEKKLGLIDNICASTPAGSMYVYSTGIESHSRADIDMRVSKAGKYADALISPKSIAAMPNIFPVAARVKSIITENAIFAMAIKAILVFLSINGWCNIWFAMFLDSAAAIFTQLNTIRVSSESLVKKLIRKREEEEEFAAE